MSSTEQSVVAGVDLAALTDWMDSVGLESGRINGARPIGGGTQNVMVRFTRGTREFVLRRGPLHLRRATNDNLRREIRLVTALAATVFHIRGSSLHAPTSQFWAGRCSI